ncbi:MAG TPA: hypothetical protein VNG12_07550 [Acidimicrobiales bacterium]|nr:hypothetical protein [Acidimicrobiales bacterium]
MTPASLRNGQSGGILKRVVLPRKRGYRFSVAIRRSPSTSPFVWLTTRTTGPDGSTRRNALDLEASEEHLTRIRANPVIT